MMLTSRQRDLLLYIDSFQKEYGISPSFEQMARALNLVSKAGIHRLINALEERNFVVRLHNRARSIEVLRLPDHEPTASFDVARKRHLSAPNVLPKSGRAEQPNIEPPFAWGADPQEIHNDPRFSKAFEVALAAVQTVHDLSVKRPSMGIAEKAEAIATLFLHHGMIPASTVGRRVDR